MQRLIIGLSFVAAATAYGLWRGGGPERWFSGILLAMLAVDRVGHVLLGQDSRAAIEGLHLVIDLAGFGAMAMVMIRARRIWPIWACSLQLLSLVSHATRILNGELPPLIPAILAIAPSYLICASLILGTFSHQRRLRRRGSDPCWRNSSPLAVARMPRSTPTSF